MAKIHKDTLLRARKDLHVEGVIIFSGPRSKYFEGVLPAGEILRLEYEPAESVHGVWLVPKRYAEMEKVFIPKEVRAERGYTGYVVGCQLDTVAELYNLVNTAS